MRHLSLWTAAVLVSCGAVAADGQATVLEPTPTLVTAAAIHTGDARVPTVRAMVFNDEGRILATGDAHALAARHPHARRLDFGTATIVPGLLDAHAHLMNLGHALLRADLVDTASKQEVIARLEAFAAGLPDGAWVLGRGWDQNDWPDGQFPTAADLDAAFPDRPVWLERVDGHAGWANSAALRAVARDLTGDWQPEGGRILRTADGHPTGVFIDAAAQLVDAVVPPPGEALREQALERALATAVANGLTGVHDMGVSLADLALMRRFADAGRLPLRIRAYADGDSTAMAALCAMGPYTHPGGRLAMHGVKFYVDGALGSRGAALLEDYSDEPGHRGLLVTEPAAYEAAVRTAAYCGLQPASHAIGDRGNRIVLDTYAKVLAERPVADHRWRVEHAQVVAVDDLPRFATLRVIASMQPTHATSDMPWAGDRVGEARLAGAYAWQSLARLGVPLALGSDFPVESVDPRLGLYSAVTRQDRQGQPPAGWRPTERLSPSQALAGFTTGAAYASREEHTLGKLAPGFHADFVVLDADPLAAPGASLPALRVQQTWVAGARVH